MKFLAATLAMLTFVISPMAVQNAHGQLELTLGGGISSPQGDYGDQADTGWALTTGVGYRVAPFFALGAEVGFVGNSSTDESLGVSYDVSTSIQHYTGMAKVLFPVGRHNVYGKGVLGSYRGIAKVSGPLGEASAENTDPGYGIGGGFMVNGDKPSSFYFDIMYHQVKYDGDDEATKFVTYNVGGVFTINLFN